MDFGCASYCKYAEQCLGSLSPELLAQKEDLFKERVAIEMKRHFKQDFKRIGRTVRVARYAEQIGKEEGGDLGPIITAAYLHGLGVDVARDILKKLDASEGLVEEVCDLIGRLDRPGSDETVNFRSLHDANLIADHEERQKEPPASRGELVQPLGECFLTEAGRELGEKILSK